MAPKVKPPSASLLGKILSSGSSGSRGAAEQILEGTLTQISDFGVRRFTVDDVAKQAGVSRVTIYRHFNSKDGLVEAVLLREIRGFLDEVDEAVRGYPTVAERSVEGFVFALTYLRNHTLFNRLLRTEPELILPLLTTESESVLAAGREFIVGVTRREVDADDRLLGDDELEVLSEVVCRLIISFVLAPTSVVGLQTEAEIRGFAEAYLAPTLEAFGRSPG